MVPSEPSDDQQRLAPVTYLFGATAPDKSERDEDSEGTRSDQPVAPDELRRIMDEIVARRPNHTAVESEPELERSPKLAARGEGKFERISNVSMNALARRGMSSAEMRSYLSSREFDSDEIEAEIARLEGVALLDDDSLAETLVRTLRDRKGLGRGALSAELRRRNLDSTAIESAMGGVEDDELARATELAIKRAPQVRSLDRATAQRRLGAFLMRKGYSGSVVSAAVASALGAAGVSTSSGPTFR